MYLGFLLSPSYCWFLWEPYVFIYLLWRTNPSMLLWLFIFCVCFFPQILGALWTWHGIRWVNICVVGTQLRAVNEHNWHWATRGSPQSQRNTTQLKTQAEATTGSRFQMCHGRVREGEKKERKEGEPRKYHRGEFTTDCTSVEEFPPRHCREVA